MTWRNTAARLLFVFLSFGALLRAQAPQDNVTPRTQPQDVPLRAPSAQDVPLRVQPMPEATPRPQPAQDDASSKVFKPDTTIVPRQSTDIVSPKDTGMATLITYFLVLVALAVMGLILIKRGLPLRGLKLGENNLELLETKMLGNRQFLVVVRYRDNKMLIGVGPGQIQYLCSLDSADEDLEKLVASGGTPQVKKVG